MGDTVNFSRSGPRRRFYAVEIIGFLRRPNIYGEDVRIKFASGLKQLARRDQLERMQVGTRTGRMSCSEPNA